MSASPRDSSGDLINKVSQQAKDFFEPQLVRLNLGEDQINNQNLEELTQSLERVNDAIQNPSSFGTLKLKMTAELGILLSKATSDYHVEVGILPILLQRKKLILERMRLLKGDQKIEELQNIAKDVTDNEVRTRLEDEITQLRSEMEKLREQNADVENAQAQSQLNAEIERSKAESELAAVQVQVEMEKFERRSKVWQSYLERESASTVIGGMLLLLIGCALITSMFLNPVLSVLSGQEPVPFSSDILNNAFLLILGYFFGQTVGKAAATKKLLNSDNIEQSQES